LSEISLKTFEGTLSTLRNQKKLRKSNSFLTLSFFSRQIIKKNQKLRKMTETQNSQSLSCGQIFAKWFCCRDDEDFTKEEKYQNFETGLNPKKIPQHGKKYF